MNDVVIVLECPVTLGFVVIVVPMKRLSHEVQTVEVMQSFDVGGEATAVFGVDLDLVRFQP